MRLLGVPLGARFVSDALPAVRVSMARALPHRRVDSPDMANAEREMMTAHLQESLEELLELLWTADEDGLTPLDRQQLPESLRCFLPHPIQPGGGDVQSAIDDAVTHGLVEASDGGRIQLTPLGRTRAEPVIRRHRLAENLLAGVLEVSEDAMESTACQMEHILSAEVADAVCALMARTSPP